MNYILLGKKVYVSTLKIVATVVNQTFDEVQGFKYKVISRNGRYHKVTWEEIEERENEIYDNRGRKPFSIPPHVNIDWSLPNRTIAGFLNTTALTVFMLRRRLGVASNPRGPRTC